MSSPETLGDRGDRGVLSDVLEVEASGTPKLSPDVVESSKNGTSCVEIDDTDELSSSPPPPRNEEDTEVFVLRGTGGSTLPGNSVRSLLCSLWKSPYLRAT